MPLPIIPMLGVIAGIDGLLSNSVANDNNKKANQIIDEAGKSYYVALEELAQQKKATQHALEKLGRLKLDIWSNEIAKFLKLYNKFHNVFLSKEVALDQFNIELLTNEKIRKMEIYATNSIELLNENSTTLPDSVLIGTAAYGTTLVAVQCLQGSVLPTITNMIAQNAGMSALCGGAIGSSMAMGSVVLGPVLAVAGHKNLNKSEVNLENANATKAKINVSTTEVKTITVAFSKIENMAKDYDSFLAEFVYKYGELLEAVKKIYVNHKDEIKVRKKTLWNKFINKNSNDNKIDFDCLDFEEQKILQLTLIATQILYKILTEKMVNDNCGLEETADGSLSLAKNDYKKLLGV